MRSSSIWWSYWSYLYMRFRWTALAGYGRHDTNHGPPLLPVLPIILIGGRHGGSGAGRGVHLISPRNSVQLRHLQVARRSEEHTSELQSREKLVCRLLLEKKKSE